MPVTLSVMVLGYFSIMGKCLLIGFINCRSPFCGLFTLPERVIGCDSCGTVVDLDVRVKPRDPEASVRVALRDGRYPRCMDTVARASWRWRVVLRFEAFWGCRVYVYYWG